MNEHLEYLQKLQSNISDLVVLLNNYKLDVVKLKELKYTPNTVVLLKDINTKLSRKYIQLNELLEIGIFNLK